MIGIEYSPYQKKYFLTFGDELRSKFYGVQTYAIIPARIIGISYPDYLRWIITQGGTIIGKTGYPVAYFDTQSDARKVRNIILKYYNNAKKM